LFFQSQPQVLSKSLNSYEVQLIAASLTPIDSEEQMRRLKPKAKGNAKLTAKGEVKSSSKKASFKQTPKGKERRLIQHIAQTTFSTIFSRGKDSLS
jgi:hypothetical protein